MNRATTLELLERATAPNLDIVFDGLDLLADAVESIDSLTGQHESASERLPMFDCITPADVTETDLGEWDDAQTDLQRIVREIGEYVDWKTRDALDAIRQYVERTA